MTGDLGNADGRTFRGAKSDGGAYRIRETRAQQLAHASG